MATLLKPQQDSTAVPQSRKRELSGSRREVPGHPNVRTTDHVLASFSPHTPCINLQQRQDSAGGVPLHLAPLAVDRPRRDAGRTADRCSGLVTSGPHPPLSGVSMGLTAVVSQPRRQPRQRDTTAVRYHSEKHAAGHQLTRRGASSVCRNDGLLRQRHTASRPPIRQLLQQASMVDLQGSSSNQYSSSSSWSKPHV